MPQGEGALPAARPRDAAQPRGVVRPPAGVGAHPPRPRAARAAQFVPFAALTGFEELLREAEREAAREEPAPWPREGE